VLVLGVLQPSIASATSYYCSPNHLYYYGEACQYSNTEYYGVQGQIQSDRLYTPDPAHQHVINDMWIVNPNSSPVHFVEAGIMFGHLCTHIDSSGVCQQWETADQYSRFFYGDDRGSCDCYYAHIDWTTAADLNTPYFDEIWREDSNDWGATIGPWGGTSSDNQLTPYLIRTGTEETTQAATSCSGQWNLEWEGTSGNWNDTWYNNGYGPAAIGEDSPPYATWMTQDSWVRDWSNLTESQCWPNGASDRSGRPARRHRSRHRQRCTTAGQCSRSRRSLLGSSVDVGPKLTEDQISQIARGAADGIGGDSAPTLIEHVEGLREQTVFSLSGDTVPSSSDVFAIVMRGHFVASGAPTPPDVPAPTGSVMVLIIDATTGQVTDLGIQDQVPDLATLGPVTSDQ
jgi:hypothetical protein